MSLGLFPLATDEYQPLAPPPSASVPPVPPPLLLRLASDIGSHVAGFLAVGDLAAVYVCSHPCRTFVAAHLKTAPHLSFGRIYTPPLPQQQPPRHASIDPAEHCDASDDGIGALRPFTIADTVSDKGAEVGTEKRSEETALVALGFRLVCAHARRLRTFDCRTLYLASDLHQYHAGGVPSEALAQLVVANHRTLQSVRAHARFCDVAVLVALRECPAMSAFDTADYACLADAHRGASTIDEMCVVELEALENALRSATHMKRVRLVARDLDWGDAPPADSVPVMESGEYRVRVLGGALAPDTVTHLEMRPATSTEWMRGCLSAQLVELKLQLAWTPFAQFCADLADRLPALVSLTDLRVSLLDGSTQAVAADELTGAPIVWRSDSLRRLVICGSAPSLATFAVPELLGTAAGVDDAETDAARVATRLDSDFGGDKSPARWPRLVMPQLDEFRGELDLEALTDLVAGAPQLATLVCLRARCRSGTPAIDDAARQAYAAAYDRRGRRLMTADAIERFVDAVRRDDALRHLTHFEVRGFPFTGAMLDAVGAAGERSGKLERVRLHLESRADPVVTGFLRRLSPSLRDCVITRLRYADDGTEVWGGSRDAPQSQGNLADGWSTTLRQASLSETARRAAARGVASLADAAAVGLRGILSEREKDEWVEELLVAATASTAMPPPPPPSPPPPTTTTMTTSAKAETEAAAAPVAMPHRFTMPRLARLRLPAPCWTGELVAALDAPVIGRLWFAARPDVPIGHLLRRLTHCRHLTIDLAPATTGGGASGLERRIVSTTEPRAHRARTSLQCGAWDDMVGVVTAAAAAITVTDPSRDRGPQRPIAAPVVSLRLDGVGDPSLLALASWLPTVQHLEVSFVETLTVTALELALTHLRLVTAARFPNLERIGFRNRLFSARDAARDSAQRRRMLAALGALAVANPRLVALDLPKDADHDARVKMCELLQPI